ncbi:MAG TPA: 3-dehydroquinate synthase [Actinomycetota bacterium]|nr:3-dehydroquinate synthase [Actinomycetota bacterium]
MTVPIPGRSYDVTIGSGVLARVAEEVPGLAAASTAFVVSDAGVAERWFDPVARSLSSAGITPVLLVVPAGEEAKSLQAYGTLLRQLAGREAHRDDPVLALGGGAIGDLAGFVASTYMRGVPFVQLPTTLTAQVDAAIGGKTAVNLPEGKNLVGTFSQPRAVLADLDALGTLDDRAYRSGLAEMAKIALTLDVALLARLEADPAPILARDPAALEDAVARCVGAKARAVAEDERDAGARMVLNYGHTVGHALERLEAFGGRTHGEAIAVGMVFAARLAEARGRAAGVAARTTRLLSALGVDAGGALPPADDVLAALRLDKKFRGGVRFVLLDEVGRPRLVDDVTDDEIRSVLEDMGVPA